MSTSCCPLLSSPSDFLNDVVPLVVVGLEVGFLVEDLGREEDVVVQDFFLAVSDGGTVNGS